MNYQTLNDALADRSQSEQYVNFINGATEEIQLSYRQLWQTALQRLAVLQQRGVKAGDQLIFFLKDNQVFIESFWACLLGGIVPVPVAVGISDEHRSKLIRIFRKLDNPYLLIDGKASELLEKYAHEQNLQDDYKRIQQHTLLAESFSNESSSEGRIHQAHPDDLAFIQFSSGSTREPKGVQLTHKNLLTNVTDIGNRIGYTQEDISLSWMPLTHDLGLIGFHINMVVFGMNQHIMPTDLFSRRPLYWLSKTSEKRASILSSPNFGYKHYLKMFHARDNHDLDLSCVRVIMNGAEPISVSLCYEFLDTLAPYGLPRSSIYTSYGLAEASLSVTMPEPGVDFEYVTVDRQTLGMGETIAFVDEQHPQALRFAVEGEAMDRCSIQIGDSDGNDLSELTVGEVQLQGANVTAGYYQDPDENAQLYTANRWLRTGDLGFIHNGKLVITGRIKDIIFANGLNYYPHDLESIALEIDGLELGKVVALGERRGESDHDDILVCILHRGDLQDFLPHIKQVRQKINEQTGLEVTHVIPVKRVPKTTSGKIQRRFFGDAYLAGEYDEIINEINSLQGNGELAGETEPASDLLQLVQELFKQAVPDRGISVNDNFFEIGISSLDLAMFQERLDEHHKGVIDITDMFEHATLNAIAELLEKRIKE